MNINQTGYLDECTLVLLKPEATRRKIEKHIIERIDWLGLSIAFQNRVLATREQCVAHYNKDDGWCSIQGQRKIDTIISQGGVPEENDPVTVGRGILELMFAHMMSGPIEVLVIQGPNAVSAMRKMRGDTEPVSAPPGTIHGDFSTVSYEWANSRGIALPNLMHCSDSKEEAERETKVWVPEFTWKITDQFFCTAL